MRIISISLSILCTFYLGHSVRSVNAQEAKTADKVPALNSRSETTAHDLWDGKTLKGWKITEFARAGDVHIDPKFKGETSAIIVEAGGALTGFNWTGDAPPKTNYEISLECLKVKGDDFMCGLTFPVADSFASLILGGWGGTLTGISSLDKLDASENETQKFIVYDKNKWYKIRMRVMPERLQAWLDDRKVVDVSIKDKKVSLRIGAIDKSVPIGITTYQTEAAYRNIRLRKLTAAEIAEPAPVKP